MFLVIGILLGLLAAAGIIYGHLENETWAKIAGYIGLTVAIILIIVHFNTAEGARAIKGLTSNVTGGLERTVQVYDQSGKMIKEYSGKIDVQDTEYGNKVLFDLNGKRTVIYNATVIVQEK